MAARTPHRAVAAYAAARLGLVAVELPDGSASTSGRLAAAAPRAALLLRIRSASSGTWPARRPGRSLSAFREEVPSIAVLKRTPCAWRRVLQLLRRYCAEPAASPHLLRPRTSTVLGLGQWPGRQAGDRRAASQMAPAIQALESGDASARSRNRPATRGNRDTLRITPNAAMFFCTTPRGHLIEQP